MCDWTLFEPPIRLSTLFGRGDSGGRDGSRERLKLPDMGVEGWELKVLPFRDLNWGGICGTGGVLWELLKKGGEMKVLEVAAVE